MKPIGSNGPNEGAEVAVMAEARNQDDSTTQGDSAMLRAAAGAEALVGQAQDAISVAPPALGERVVVESAPGAVYLLEFAPGDATFVVEGDDIVMTFDVDGDGAADSHIVFLGLAGMAGAADAPTLKIAGVDYDVSSLIDTAETLEEARDLAEEPGVAPSGLPPQETAGGPDDSGQPPRSGGSSQYEDDLGSQAFSTGSEALSGVGGPLGADSGPGVISGKVITGLPRLAAQDGQITTLPDSDGGGDGIETVAGQVVDGYIVGATVFRDANNNGKLDTGEVSGTTDINGNFSLTGGSGPLIATGGTDVSTGLAFDGVLKAPEGSTVITPLTTLVQQLVDDGDTAAAAETKVKKAFGISDSFDLTKTDPVKAAAGGGADAADAAAVVKAGIAVANTAKQIKSALKKGSDADQQESASDSAFKAIATQVTDDVTGPNKTTDTLKDGSVVEDVIRKAAEINNQAVDTDDVTKAANVIKTSVASVDKIDASASDALTKLAKAAKVAQGAASKAIEDDQTENYDEESEVDAAETDAQIGVVDGSDGDGREAEFLAAWVQLDASYVDALPEQKVVINEAFVRLGEDYVDYLNSGGEAFLTFVKVSGVRSQTLHDNLLGNLNTGAINNRISKGFLNDDPRTEVGNSFGDRPWHSGKLTAGEYDDGDARAVIEWDFENGINYPDNIPDLYKPFTDGTRSFNASFSEDFEDFNTGAIADGEGGWTILSTATDQEVFDLGGEHGLVFRMSSDPGGGKGLFSPPVQREGEAEFTVGEPQTTADVDTLVISYDFKAVSDTPDSSRLEIDFDNSDLADRNSFLVLEWEESVGLRIAVNEPILDDTRGAEDGWTENTFHAFNGNVGLVDGLDLEDGAQWHRLTMELLFIDGPDNDVINIYLDGDKIGTTTTFENYFDNKAGEVSSGHALYGNDHAANAELTQAAGLVFRPSNGHADHSTGDVTGGAAQDGAAEGQNLGFYFDNIDIVAYDSADSLVTG